MDVRLSPEQRALRDSAAAVVDRLGPRTVHDLEDPDHTRHHALDAAVVASGWRELRHPLDGGAPLASAVEVALVSEQLGRGLIDVPFLGPVLASELCRLAGAPPSGSTDERETVLLTPDLAALVSVEPDAAAVDGVLIDGDGSTVRALLLVHGPEEPTLGSVRPTAVVPLIDLTRSSAGLGPSSAVGRVGGGPLSAEALARFDAFALAITTADLVGTMQGALDLAVGYAKERRQYGSLIGSFQAVQHLLADAHVATEGSRSLALHAAWAVDALPADEALVAAATAKAYASRAARSVCETSIQVHGGIGNTWECLAHVFLRRALLSIDVLGGVGRNLDRVLAHAGIGAR